MCFDFKWPLSFISIQYLPVFLMPYRYTSLKQSLTITLVKRFRHRNRKTIYSPLSSAYTHCDCKHKPMLIMSSFRSLFLAIEHVYINYNVFHILYFIFCSSSQSQLSNACFKMLTYYTFIGFQMLSSSVLFYSIIDLLKYVQNINYLINFRNVDFQDCIIMRGLWTSKQFFVITHSK